METGMLEMIALMAAVAMPQPPIAQRFGEWRAYERPGLEYAVTVNDTGSEFGIGCQDDLCVYFVNPHKDCVEDREYTLLLRNSVGATVMNALCLSLAGRPQFAFKSRLDPDEMLAGDQITFALPIEDSRFRIMKFSLDGGRQAVGWAIDRWKQSRASATR